MTYSMGTSLDGYIVGPDGGFDWSTPDDGVFALATEELRGVAVHLMGRQLYETMLYWELPENQEGFDAAEREWADLWTAVPKVVFSRTLTAVQGSSRLATGTLAQEIAHWRAEPGEGEIAIGGAGLAAEAAGEIDEYRLRVYPILVGGGTPYFPRSEHRADLELLESRLLSPQVTYQRYRVVRARGTSL